MCILIQNWTRCPSYRTLLVSHIQKLPTWNSIHVFLLGLVYWSIYALFYYPAQATRIDDTATRGRTSSRPQRDWLINDKGKFIEYRAIVFFLLLFSIPMVDLVACSSALNRIAWLNIIQTYKNFVLFFLNLSCQTKHTKINRRFSFTLLLIAFEQLQGPVIMIFRF